MFYFTLRTWSSGDELWPWWANDGRDSLACGLVTFQNASYFVVAGGRKVIDGVTEVRSEIYVANEDGGTPRWWRSMADIGGQDLTFFVTVLIDL